MKLHVEITFKTPDATNDAISRMVSEELPAPLPGTVSEELSMQRDELSEKIRSVVDQFVRDGEYITIDFDIERGTATVNPV